MIDIQVDMSKEVDNARCSLEPRYRELPFSHMEIASGGYYIVMVYGYDNSPDYKTTGLAVSTVLEKVMEDVGVRKEHLIGGLISHTGGLILHITLMIEVSSEDLN